MGVYFLVGMSAGVFREVWKEEAEKAEKMQEGEWGLKKDWDSDRAWDFIRQTATEIALIHPGQAALDWAAAVRPELMQEIAMMRDSIRDAVHDQDIIKVFKVTEDWKRAYVGLFEAYEKIVSG